METRHIDNLGSACRERRLYIDQSSVDEFLSGRIHRPDTIQYADGILELNAVHNHRKDVIRSEPRPRFRLLLRQWAEVSNRFTRPVQNSES